MKTGSLSVFKKMGAVLVFTALACGPIFIGVSALYAAGNPADSAFRDPYNGGIKLPDGGGEPGKAYMAFISAAYAKDHAQICKLMADPADLAPCLQQKEALDGYIAMFTLPKSQQVLGGFMKGQEATLNVAYTFTSGPQSTGFVVMTQAKGRWTISSFGGSGSASVSVEASGQVDLGSSAVSGSASVGGETPEFAIVRISATPKEYTGKCPVNITWTADITFKMPPPDNFSYHWEFSDGRKTQNKVAKPPLNGRMSIREVWKGGKPGSKLEASVRFAAESGDNSIVLDPPGVKVVCQ